MKISNKIYTNGTITIRPLEFTDIKPCFVSIRESIDELSRWMWWCHRGYSIEETRMWIESSADAWESGIDFSFAIIDDKDQSFLGSCGLSQINQQARFANLGYWVRRSRTGQGIASAAALLVSGFGFNELGLNRLEIVVATENMTSQRVAQKVGAQYEGILRERIIVRDKIHDAHMYSILSDDFSSL